MHLDFEDVFGKEDNSNNRAVSASADGAAAEVRERSQVRWGETASYYAGVDTVKELSVLTVFLDLIDKHMPHPFLGTVGGATMKTRRPRST